MKWLENNNSKINKAVVEFKYVHFFKDDANNKNVLLNDYCVNWCPSELINKYNEIMYY